ncbi:DsbA family protein [Spirosoma montaniterrae]|uniref:Protein-disulfide isomerase n=1 Tax=Spirosoma montaniterrae TaxID=1178516 RepID=A0A1P9WVU5_9BACT|nr:DsbA family protein [Spirosoma montaniterrae]AQG79499.1 protein-disulfide isomerase [Spirosoma montaniterrae]
MSRPRIIYVYDALCGWCYGFSPVIRQLYASYGDQADFDVLSGGMMTGTRVRPVSESMGYIQQAYKTVEDHTGVRFGDAYLNGLLAKGTYLSDSEKPGMAMTLFKAISPDQAVLFASTLQHALYYDGVDLNVDAHYGPLVEPFGIDPDEFVAHVSDAAIKEQTWAEFNLVSQYGINGFPSVIVDTGDKLYQVARGYLPYDALEANVKRALNSPE